MQISPLNVDSLLPVAKKSAPAAAEAGKGFSRSLQDQEQVRSRQKAPETAKEPRTEPPRSHEAASKEESRNQAEDADRKDIEKGSRHTRTDDHAEDRDRASEAPIKESDRLPKASAGKPEKKGHESCCLDNIDQDNAEALPVQVADVISLPPQSALVDSPVESGADPQVVTAEAESPVLPVPFVEDGVGVLPVAAENKLTENAMPGPDATTDVDHALAAPVVGQQPIPEVTQASDEAGDVVVVEAKNPVAEDPVPEAPLLAPLENPAASTAVPLSPARSAAATAVTAAPAEGASSLPADIPALENSEPVSPFKAFEAAEPAVSSQKKWAGFAPVRNSHGTSVPATGPLAEGKVVVESLQVGVPLTTRSIQPPLATDVTDGPVIMSAEVVQAQAAVQPKKPTLLRGADPGNTSDQRFAQLLGDKGFSSKLVDARTVPVESPVEAVLEDAGDLLADDMTQRLGAELSGLKSDGAKSPGLGLAKMAVEPASVGGSEVQFGGASPINGPPGVAGASASVAGMFPRLPIAEEQIFEQVVGRLSLAKGERHSKVTMKLYPEELGQVRLEMSVEGDRVRVHMHAQSQQVQDVLEKYLPRLRESFENQGLKLEDVSVSSESSQHGGKGFSQEQQAANSPRYFTRRSYRGGEAAEIDPPVVSSPSSRPGGINLRI